MQMGIIPHLMPWMKRTGHISMGDVGLYASFIRANDMEPDRACWLLVSWSGAAESCYYQYGQVVTSDKRNRGEANERTYFISCEVSTCSDSAAHEKLIHYFFQTNYIPVVGTKEQT